MPMTQLSVQRAHERGGGQVTDWLRTAHLFSFDSWHDPKYVHWGPLRVLNHDYIAGESGFGFHPHRDMEIVTYVLRGEVHHRDSHGSDGRIRPGMAQRMSAGSGVLHSEWNDKPEELELLQVWIMPRKSALGGPFGYEEAAIPAGSRENGWHVVAEGRAGKTKGAGTVSIQQDAAMMATTMTEGQERTLDTSAGRLGFLYVSSGSLEVDGLALSAGDAIRWTGPGSLRLRASTASHLVGFDLAP